MVKKLLLFIGLFSLFANARDSHSDERCFEACQIALEELIFAPADTTDYYVEQCTNQLRITSMYACAHEYCTHQEIDAGIRWANDTCVEEAHTATPSYESEATKFTSAFIKNLTVIGPEDVIVDMLNTSVLVSRAYQEIALRTDNTWYFEINSHIVYGWAMYGFFGGILFLGICNNFYGFMAGNNSSRSTTAMKSENNANSEATPTRFRRLHLWSRAHISTPATFGYHHQQSYWGLHFPTRLEFVIVVAYTILNVILCAVNYDCFQGNLYWPKTASQVWRYLADRTGIMSFANLPWLWLFSGRNNIFLWLTGWDYATFNLLHRTIARIATAEAILHSIGYTAFEFVAATPADYNASWKEQYWYTGAIATIAMSFLILFSFSWIRHRLYDLFLLIHISLSLITLVCLFYHVKIFEGEYDYYLWPLVALWCFDRFARLVRLVYLNFHVWNSSGNENLKITKANATYDGQSNIIRLDVTPATMIKGGLRPGPGQHYFLYMPLAWKGWENHPFTLADWSHGTSHSEGAASTPTSDISRSAVNDLSISIDEKKTFSQPLSTPSSNSADPQSALKTRTPILTFLIRPPRSSKSSFTARLRQLCLSPLTTAVATTATAATSAQSRSITLLLEGPYGHAAPLDRYENVVLVAGGSGITAALTYIKDFIGRNQRFPSDSGSGQSSGDEKIPQSTTNAKHLTLIWSARHISLLESVLAKELHDAVNHPSISFKLYFTATQPTTVAEQSLVSDPSPSDLKPAHTKSTTPFQITPARPDLPTLVPESIYNPAANSAAVLCCGPAQMSDTVRSVVTGVMTQVKAGRGGATLADVRYFEERFDW